MRPPKKDDSLFLSKQQWRKVFLAMSIMTIVLYIVAMVVSLSGNTYFILNYQNEQMDRIENFLSQYRMIDILRSVFLTLEFSIVLSFVLQKVPKWYYLVSFFALPLIPHYLIGQMPDIVYTIIPFVFHIFIPAIDLLIKKEFSWKLYGKQMLRLLIAVSVVFTLQLAIYVIKAGYFSVNNHVMNLSATFIYALEYDIALFVILFTISLYINRGKGDSREWTDIQHLGSSSQTSTTLSQKSNTKKNLTKTQRRKIRWLYAKLYITQLGAFLLIMVLPFLLGKVLEFLVMYLSFAIIRYILGFKYSLHFKKEALCISVGLVVFGILSLAVPFFYVVLIIAVLMGSGLAVLLHLSYKYKSMWLFNQVSKPDKFAVLYTFFDGDLGERHIKMICQHKGLDHFQTLLIYNYMRGEKMSYLAFKFNYSQRMLIYKLNEAIDALLK